MDKNKRKNSTRRISDLTEDEESGLRLLVDAGVNMWNELDDSPFGALKRLIERSYTEIRNWRKKE